MVSSGTLDKCIVLEDYCPEAGLFFFKRDHHGEAYGIHPRVRSIILLEAEIRS